MNKFFKGRILSVSYAIKGFILLIKTEHSIKAQVFIFICISMLGFYLGISKQDWINQTLAMGLVLSTEGVNTSVEKICDFTHEDIHPKIEFIKDIAAGAVTFAMLTFIIILIITYQPFIFAHI